MSNDDEMQRIREARLRQLQQQQQDQAQAQYQQAAYQQQQQAQFEAQKRMILQKVLDTEARARLTNIKLARPEFGEQMEIQLIQAFQSGALRGQIPLTDEKFRAILVQLQNQTKSRERQIRFK